MSDICPYTFFGPISIAGTRKCCTVQIADGFKYSELLNEVVLAKCCLKKIADGLKSADPLFIDFCVNCVLSNARCIGSERINALMCRRLKHCKIDESKQFQLINCILGRLITGAFTEQFKDQLRLALHLDFITTQEIGWQCLNSKKAYIRRYAEWLLIKG